MFKSELCGVKDSQHFLSVVNIRRHEQEILGWCGVSTLYKPVVLYKPYKVVEVHKSCLRKYFVAADRIATKRKSFTWASQETKINFLSVMVSFFCQSNLKICFPPVFWYWFSEFLVIVVERVNSPTSPAAKILHFGQDWANTEWFYSSISINARYKDRFSEKTVFILDSKLCRLPANW